MNPNDVFEQSAEGSDTAIHHEVKRVEPQAEIEQPSGSDSREQSVSTQQEPLDDKLLEVREALLDDHIEPQIVPTKQVQLETRYPAEGSSLKRDIEGVGLPFLRTLLAWDASAPWREQHTVYQKNLERMYALEAARPKSVRTLHDEFSITNFGRYPERVLLRQFDQRNDSSLPYGLALFPEGDKNGVYYDNTLSLEDLSDQMFDHEYAMRIFEIGGRNDLLDALQASEDRYRKDPNNKISYGILLGHGDSKGKQLVFRDPDFLKMARGLLRGKIEGLDFSLSTKSIKGKSMAQFGRYFHDWADIVLSSCEVGKQGGLRDAFEAIKPVNGTVIAPEDSVDHYIVTAKFGGDVPVRLATETNYMAHKSKLVSEHMSKSSPYRAAAIRIGLGK